jgi:protein involved in polysaccharide export with SLBB domain
MMKIAVAVMLVLGTGAAAGAQTEAPATSPAPAKTIRVQVLGSVSRPGIIEVSEGDRLLLALARAGIAAPMRPDLRRIVLVRADPETSKPPRSYTIDVSEGLRHADRRYDPVLRANDKIFVPESPKAGGPPSQIAVEKSGD